MMEKPKLRKYTDAAWLDRHIERITAFINWMINGQFIHGISPMMFKNLTPERIEELYNVEFPKDLY